MYLFVSSLIFWHFTFLIWLFVPCLLKMIVYLKIINKISAFAWTNTCMHLYWRTNWNVEYVWNDASKKKFFFSSSVKCYKTNDTKRHGREKKIHKKWFDWLSRAIYNNNLQYVLWSQYYVFDWMDREIPSSKRKYNIKWIQLYIKCIYHLSCVYI